MKSNIKSIAKHINLLTIAPVATTLALWMSFGLLGLTIAFGLVIVYQIALIYTYKLQIRILGKTRDLGKIEDALFEKGIAEMREQIATMSRQSAKASPAPSGGNMVEIAEEAKDGQLTVSQAWGGSMINVVISGRECYNSKKTRQMQYLLRAPEGTVFEHGCDISKSPAKLHSMISSIFQTIEGKRNVIMADSGDRGLVDPLPIPPELVQHIYIDLPGSPSALPSLNLTFDEDDSPASDGRPEPYDDDSERI